MPASIVLPSGETDHLEDILKRIKSGAVAAIAAVAALLTTGATAAMMTTHLHASLSGMGDHGTVKLTVNTDAKRLCWTLTVPMVRGITGASIHTGSSSATLVELGMHYAARGCETEPAMTLEHLAASPKTYYVWLNTKGHPGDLRGQLHSGM
jgi:hydroxymethylglutaryl-CoA reductase